MRPLLLKSAIVITVCLLSAASLAAQAPTAASLGEAVQKSFGAVVEALSYSKPFYLTGDINAITCKTWLSWSASKEAATRCQRCARA
jgi:hypothetical protein